MNMHLKIKIKSLAGEARIIRHEEKRFKRRAAYLKGKQLAARSSVASDINAGLHQHRVIDVRREQRAALLAYGFLRGMPYQRIERNGRFRYVGEPFVLHDDEKAVLKRALEIADKFGQLGKDAAKVRLQEWLTAQPMAVPVNSSQSA